MNQFIANAQDAAELRLSEDRRSMMRNIVMNRDDDAPRLIFADWVEETFGDSERAQFIRDQVDLWNIFQHEGDDAATSDPRYKETTELAKIRCKQWIFEDLGVNYTGLIQGDSFNVTYYRGFPYYLNLSIKTWIKNHALFYEFTPIEIVQFKYFDYSVNNDRVRVGYQNRGLISNVVEFLDIPLVWSPLRHRFTELAEAGNGVSNRVDIFNSMNEFWKGVFFCGLSDNPIGRVYQYGVTHKVVWLSDAMPEYKRTDPPAFQVGEVTGYSVDCTMYQRHLRMLQEQNEQLLDITENEDDADDADSSND